MKTDKYTKWTALYERLSRDDDTLGDSVSIAHQKTYLRKYADEHGFVNCHDYTDDGWSGGTFDRPAWNQMIADIEDGKVDTVIVKDMSRVGRDYLQTGFYTEIYFAQKRVRFIAIDSRVDNMRSDSNEFAPVLNVFNEMYLHDQSRKVRIGFHARGVSGKPLVSTPNFGYLKDPEDKNRWRIDPAAAETVRRIFELAASGNNPNQIAGTLREEQRMTPGTYFAERGQRNRCNNKKKAGAYDWSRSMVTSLLRAREYLGETVNFKTAKTSYKAKRVATPRDAQLVFTGTHEAIVDPETWERAQQMLKQRARPHAAPCNSPWRGKVICAQCGAPMYPLHQKVKLRNGNDSLREFFICSTHRNALDKAESPCSANTFSAKALRVLLTDTIHTVSRYALENEDDFVQRLHSGVSQDWDHAKAVKRRIAALERRASKLDRLLKKLYEEYALERIPESRYDLLSAEYETELAHAEEAIAEEKQRLEKMTVTQDSAERFLELARRFQDCAAFTDEQLNLFTDRVIVHETVKDADGERSRSIEVILNFIGAFRIPAEPVALTSEEIRREEMLKKRRIYERRRRQEKRLTREANAQMK